MYARGSGTFLNFIQKPQLFGSLFYPEGTELIPTQFRAKRHLKKPNLACRTSFTQNKGYPRYCPDEDQPFVSHVCLRALAVLLLAMRTRIVDGEIIREDDVPARQPQSAPRQTSSAGTSVLQTPPLNHVPRSTGGSSLQRCGGSVLVMMVSENTLETSAVLGCVIHAQTSCSASSLSVLLTSREK